MTAGPLTLTALAVALAACHGEPSTETDSACDPGWVTWENFAEPQIVTWCTPCHSENLTGDLRNGAPVSVDLDTLDDARQHAARIAARVDDGTMPPAGGLTDEERRLLADWAN
ncbi:MAG: hypothetical protein ABMB14_40510, partial [Myxococcota bacterium]